MVSNGLHTNQDRRFVDPALRPNCLPMYSAYDKSRPRKEKVKSIKGRKQLGF